MSLAESLKPSLHKRQKRRDNRLSDELIECYRGGRRTKSSKGYQKDILRDEFAHALQKESIKLMKGNSKYPEENQTNNLVATTTKRQLHESVRHLSHKPPISFLSFWQNPAFKSVF